MSLLLTLSSSVEPLKPCCDAGATGFERDLALLLDDAERLLGAIGVELLAGGDACELLVLAEVLLHTHRLEVVEAGVEGDHRDALGRLSRLHRGRHGVGLGERQCDPGDLAVDRALHQVGLVGGFGIVRVTQFDVVLVRGGLAPLRIRSQKESPGTSWVIIATVIRGVFTPPPVPPPLPPVSAGLPPVLEHAASTTADRTAPMAKGTRRPRDDCASAALH